MVEALMIQETPTLMPAEMKEHRERARVWFETLRDQIHAGFEALEDAAPADLFPGEAGRFVPDETVAVTLRVPPEFVRECRRVQMTPQELLRSFAGDLAGIQNFVACPRADGYGSNGSDEREYADAWLHRAHAMNAIDLDEQDAREAEAEEKQFQRDDFAALLDDFESYGGKADDLFAAVQALVDKQAETDGD